jgi:hypothetical protein
LESKLIQAKEVLNESQNHYNCAGMNAHFGRGSPIGASRPDLQQAANNRFHQKFIDAKETARMQLKLAKERHETLCKEKIQLEQEIRDLQSSFSKSCVIESQLKGVN